MKVILITILLATLIGSIAAGPSDEQLQDCIGEFLDQVRSLEVPERIEQVAEIVRSYEPTNSNMTAILANFDIDTGKFVKDESDLEEIQNIASDFSLRPLEILAGNTCIMDVEFEESFVKELEKHRSDPELQKVSDYMNLCETIQAIGDQ